MDLQIDTSEIGNLVHRFEAAAAAAPQLMDEAGRAAGLAVERFAKSYIPVASGTAKAATGMKSVSADATGVTVVVASSAQSRAGYPYPQVLEHGTRGDIVPKAKKYLAFEVGGKKVFTKRVKQRQGTHFFSRAVKSAEPFVRRQFEVVVKRLQRIAGG